MLRSTLSLLLAFCGFIQARELPIISYNIRYDTKGDTGNKDWSARKSTVLHFLKRGEIIGLQEVLRHQLDDITEQLPHFKAVGVGRNDGKNAGEFTPILFDKRKWSIDPAQQGTFWLSDTPDTIASTSWGNQITRICTWARLVDNNGAGIYIFNTHWDHRSQKSREKAARLMITKLQQRRYIDEPVVLLGDLNATTQNPATQLLLDASDWRKRRHLIDPSPQFLTFNTWQSELKKGLRIDHIFTSPFLPILKSSVIANGNQHPGSDHHPLLTIAQWDSSERTAMLERLYIKETLLGKEHGGGEGFIIRWKSPATVRVIGGNEHHRAQLANIIDELNAALEGTGMHYSLSDQMAKNELRVYFDHSSKLAEHGKSENIEVHNNVDGFAGLTWTTRTKVVESACVFIATDKAQGELLRHIILEEVTQTLGLMGDTSVYPESVTFSRYKNQGSAPQLGQCDINGLRLIYGHLEPGDDGLTTGIAYAKYWGK